MFNTDTRRSSQLSHWGTAVALLAGLWLPHANAAAEEIDGATGKITRSPVLGARAPDGTMGGIIPSAVPGWTPHLADAHDAYVYIPREGGWDLGDTRLERSGDGGGSVAVPATDRATCHPDVPCIR